MTMQLFHAQPEHKYLGRTMSPNQDVVLGFRKETGILDLAFDSKSLRSVCENEEDAQDKLGPSVAETLKHRLADLRAAISIRDLLVGKPRIIKSTKFGQEIVIVELGDGYQLVFGANHPNNPILENGDINWAKVSRIKILQIERNHV